eukprot:scaffold83722_cov25-Tisochrysis_lutea.AAC.2
MRSTSSRTNATLSRSTSCASSLRIALVSGSRARHFAARRTETGASPAVGFVRSWMVCVYAPGVDASNTMRKLAVSPGSKYTSGVARTKGGAAGRHDASDDILTCCTLAGRPVRRPGSAQLGSVVVLFPASRTASAAMSPGRETLSSSSWVTSPKDKASSGAGSAAALECEAQTSNVAVEVFATRRICSCGTPGLLVKARWRADRTRGAGCGGGVMAVSKASFRRAATCAAISACFRSLPRAKLETRPSASSRSCSTVLPASGLGILLSGRIFPSTMVCFRSGPSTAFTYAGVPFITSYSFSGRTRNLSSDESDCFSGE